MNTILLSNICFLILLIQSSSIASLKTQTPKFSSFIQKQSTSIQISGDFNSTKEVRDILSATIGESIDHKDTYYFIFLAKSLESFKKINQKFKSTLFDVFNNIIDLKYYQDKTKGHNSFVHIIIINAGTIIEDKKVKAVNDEFFSFILNKYNIKNKLQAAISKANEILTSVIEAKNDTDQESIQNVSLIEKKKKLFVQKKQIVLAEKKENNNRLTRFIWALLMVLIFSIAVFFFVKYSIDWATASKTELNKLKDQKLREITDALITKEFLKEEE